MTHPCLLVLFETNGFKDRNYQLSGFLQRSQCFFTIRVNLPPSLSLLMRNPCPKDNTRSDILKLKVSQCCMKSLGKKESYKASEGNI